MTHLENGMMVQVRMRINDKAPNNGSCVVCTGFLGDQVRIAREDIVHVESRPLQVGDKVMWGTGVVVYELRAIDGNYAMIKSDGDCYRALRIDALRRAR